LIETITVVAKQLLTDDAPDPVRTHQEIGGTLHNTISEAVARNLERQDEPTPATIVTAFATILRRGCIALVSYQSVTPHDGRVPTGGVEQRSSKVLPGHVNVLAPRRLVFFVGRSPPLPQSPRPQNGPVACVRNVPLRSDPVLSFPFFFDEDA
jgi:hypothetical protein